MAGWLEARRSGQGQVVDAAICDGVLPRMGNNPSRTLRGLHQEKRGHNMLDGGAPCHAAYETAADRAGSRTPLVIQGARRHRRCRPVCWRHGPARDKPLGRRPPDALGCGFGAWGWQWLRDTRGAYGPIIDACPRRIPS